MSKNKRDSVIKKNSAELNTDILKDTSDFSLKRKFRRRFIVLIIAVLALFIAGVAFTGTAYSWFAPKQVADLSVYVSDFSAKTEFSFDASGYEELSDDKLIPVSNLGALRLRVSYTGPSAAYIRIQLFESFKDSYGNLIPSADVVYNLGNGWVEKDGYLYYKDAVMQKSMDSDPVNIPLSVGAALAEGQNVDSGSSINLVSLIEMAQPDRFDEFFGISYNEVFGISDANEIS